MEKLNDFETINHEDKNYEFDSPQDFLDYFSENPPVVKTDDFDSSFYVTFGGRDFRSMNEFLVQVTDWGFTPDEAKELCAPYFAK